MRYRVREMVATLLGGLLTLAAPALCAQDQAQPYQDPSQVMQHAPDPGQPNSFGSMDDQAAYGQPGGQAAFAGQQSDAAGEPQQGSVARLSYIQGPVSTQRGDSGDWSSATLNTPVVPGDRISTGEGGRAELQLDASNIIRLAENTIIRIRDLSAGSMQIEVAQGLVSFNSFANSSSVAEIDTSNLAIHPWRDGSYRVQVTLEGETLVAVRRGQAEVGTADGSTTVRAGQLVTVQGDANSAQYRITAAPARDGFDHWNADRDQIIQRAQSWQHVNQNYTGAQDLDNYGSWQTVPDYGEVWQPSEPQNWAPYRDGSWVWEPGWGWTWVSAEPWGWAPYHYGRWFLYNNAWSWWPGPVTPDYQPEWAPAYVNFFGFGSNVWGDALSALGSFFSFGWLPIGPWDHFSPWWGGWGHHYGSAGYGHFGESAGGRGAMAPLAMGRPFHSGMSNLSGLATNSRLLSGLTAVAANRFGAGRVLGNMLSISRNTLAGARAFHGAVPVVPSHASLSASGRPAAAGTVPGRNLDGQRFFQHNQPRAQQHSFAAESAQFRQQLLQQHAPIVNARGDGPRQPAGAGQSLGASRIGETSRSFGSNNAPGRSSSFSQGRASGFAQAGGESFRQPGITGQQGSAQTRFEGQNSAGAWQSFHGAGAQSGSTAGRSFSQSNAAARPGWQRFSPQSGSSAGRGAQAAPESRPQLNLHKSIVQEGRSQYGGSSGASRGATQSHSGTGSRPQAFNSAPFEPRGYSSMPGFGASAAPRGGFENYRAGNGGFAGGSHGEKQPHFSSNGGSHGGGGSHMKAPHMSSPHGGGSHGGGSHGGGSHGGHGGHHH